MDYEVMETLANDFIFGTILDRFPKLKVMCSEFEVAWIPSFMFRIDQIQNDYAHRMTLPKLNMRASDYMRTRIWHGFIDDPFAMDALPSLGADHIVWGSDFPHIRSRRSGGPGETQRAASGNPTGGPGEDRGEEHSRRLGPELRLLAFSLGLTRFLQPEIRSSERTW